MTTDEAKDLKVGQIIRYNDGRPGHTDAKAVVLEVTDSRMVVSFEDRADTTVICFSDRAWLDHLAEVKS